ncbi:hypothetical protein H072_6198 [Dactylellina haptotyla CBS 200.50]|uniref:UBA domain-containing protein n=1 Tax=Dactylellina haptotyla (strain CBS 200.50) TaxID=1284197 RepID=S8AA00_DACHA|nr:hypothetical protein H072_6198 [Dactylellina haptotyla CBS 200.50]
MDDLTGLNWSSSANPAAKQSPFAATSSLAPAGNYTSFRSTPTLTPQSTNPISRPNSTKPSPNGKLLRDGSSAASGAAGASSGSDSFSSLVSFSAKKSGNSGNLSLLEQQKKLQEDKLRADQLKQQRLDQQFSGLDSLGSFGTTAGNPLQGRSGTSTPARYDPEEADLLAGFSADTKVNRASHFPPPSATPPTKTPSPMPARSIPSPQPQQPKQRTFQSSNLSDDPFNLDSFGKDLPSQPQQAQTSNDDDDILGDLGKPVSEVKRKSPSPPPKPTRPSRRPVDAQDLRSAARTPPPGKDPRDPALAELADMGFTVEDAKRALAQTDTGLDVRAAIDFLLNEAHGKPTKSRGQSHVKRGEDEYGASNRRPGRERGGGTPKPAWQTQGDVQDVAAYAQKLGGNLLKTAGSLWATGSKKVAQAINDLQDDNPNDGTPKWMKDAQREQRSGSSRRTENHQTDEAMMLEAGGDPKRGKQSQRPPRERMPMSREDENFAEEQKIRQMAREERERRQESEQKSAVDPRRSKLTREATESEQVYISPSRRRKPAAPTVAPAFTTAPVPEGDLLFGSASSDRTSVNTTRSTPSAPPVRSSNPFSQPKPRPAAPTPAPRSNRQIPALSPSALASSTTSRTAGTDAFKRGDYPSALTHYTSSLSPVPSAHPIHYLILTNRAIVHIKLGDSKAALEDCDAVISGIGSGKGAGESFDLDGTSKDLKEVWGKAILRRAEALEHLERWSDAGQAWGLAVENGVGGASASAGKSRCEKALAPKAPPKPVAAKKPQPRPPPRRPVTTAQSAEAVSRLRAANAAADKADEEKLALHDTVEARLAAWKGGKETNLRALIASLDTVLWDGSGWKKVGMHELVMPNKVKIAYMKGIAKVHPDKISQDATTEQRMLAAAVFSTMNEAWDEFKKQNNL